MEISEKIVDTIKKRNLNKQNVLTKESKIKDDDILIGFLYYYQIKPKKCEICKINQEWNNKFLPFLIYRKNNILNDNSLDNIKLLCPNCYYQKSPIKKNNCFIDLNKNSKKFINCIDCNRKFKKQIYKISLNLNDENAKKHTYIKKRCQFCLDKKLVESDSNLENISKPILEPKPKPNQELKLKPKEIENVIVI